MKLGYIFKLIDEFKTDERRPFKDFVDELYSLRLNTKSKAKQLFYKFILNTIYGKWAEKIIKPSTTLVSGIQDLFN